MNLYKLKCTASQIHRPCSTSLLSDKCHVLRTGFLSVGFVVTMVGRKPFQLESWGRVQDIRQQGWCLEAETPCEVQGTRFMCLPLGRWDPPASRNCSFAILQYKRKLPLNSLSSHKCDGWELQPWAAASTRHLLPTYTYEPQSSFISEQSVPLVSSWLA